MIAHRCRTYINARGEVIDPADQGGIGCPDHRRTDEPGRPVKRLQPGDRFGPLATDREHDGEALEVAALERVDRRNLYDVTDQYGRRWRTGGERMAGDCYGWIRQYT